MATLRIFSRPSIYRLLYSPSYSLSISKCYDFQPRRQFSLDSIFVAVPNFLSHWSLTQFCQWTLENVHLQTGLPWWATIVGTTLAFKLLTSPLLYANENALATYSRMKTIVLKKMIDLKPELDTYDLSIEKKQRLMKSAANRTENVLREQMRAHPFAILCWPLLQAPVWIGMSFAVRNLSGQSPFYFEYDDTIVDQLTTQGLAWFSNLTIPDPMYILPAAICSLYLMAPTISSLGLPPAAQKTPLYRLGRILNIGVTGMITYVSIHVPAILVLYWTSSIFFTLILRMILKLPRVRRRLAIPLTLYESERPIKEFALRTVGMWRPKISNVKKTIAVLVKK